MNHRDFSASLWAGRVSRQVSLAHKSWILVKGKCNEPIIFDPREKLRNLVLTFPEFKCGSAVVTDWEPTYCCAWHIIRKIYAFETIQLHKEYVDFILTDQKKVMGMHAMYTRDYYWNAWGWWRSAAFIQNLGRSALLRSTWWCFLALPAYYIATDRCCCSHIVQTSHNLLC